MQRAESQRRAPGPPSARPLYAPADDRTQVLQSLLGRRLYQQLAGEPIARSARSTAEGEHLCCQGQGRRSTVGKRSNGPGPPGKWKRCLALCTRAVHAERYPMGIAGAWRTCSWCMRGRRQVSRPGGSSQHSADSISLKGTAAQKEPCHQQGEEHNTACDPC